MPPLSPGFVDSPDPAAPIQCTSGQLASSAPASGVGVAPISPLNNSVKANACTATSFIKESPMVMSSKRAQTYMTARLAEAIIAGKLTIGFSATPPGRPPGGGGVSGNRGIAPRPGDERGGARVRRF